MVSGYLHFLSKVVSFRYFFKQNCIFQFTDFSINTLFRHYTLRYDIFSMLEYTIKHFRAFLNLFRDFLFFHDYSKPIKTGL